MGPGLVPFGVSTWDVDVRDLMVFSCLLLWCWTSKMRSFAEGSIILVLDTTPSVTIEVQYSTGVFFLIKQAMVSTSNTTPIRTGLTEWNGGSKVGAFGWPLLAHNLAELN